MLEENTSMHSYKFEVTPQAETTKGGWLFPSGKVFHACMESPIQSLKGTSKLEMRFGTWTA